MPRYMVQRTFPDGLHIPIDDDGVTWVQSYVSDDRAKTFCLYDAPDPEAIRRTAAGNDLPVNAITEVRVLDPYFYR